MKKRVLLSFSLLLLVLLIAACSGDDSAEGNDEDSDTSEQEQEEAGEETSESDMEQPEIPELEDIPDVVAEVNGEEISKEEFETTYESQIQQFMMQAQMSGQEIDEEQIKEQIIEGLIAQKLVIQEAENSGFEASEEDMDETFDLLVEQSGLESKDDLFSAFEEQGIDEAELMEQIEMQVKIDKLIDDRSDDVEPTEEELEELYEMYIAQLEQMGGEDEEEVEIPSFEELEPDLIAQVEAEKESEAYQTLIEELREDADITNHL